MLALLAALWTQEPATAIVHVTVVDVELGRTHADRTVLLRGGRIEAVGAAAQVSTPAGATVVDGRGKYLIPGLWDMHVHTTVPGGEALLALFPVYGIVGVRDMNDSFPQIQTWRAGYKAGSLLGPRIVAAGPYLVGQAPPLPHLLVTSAQSGRNGVDSLRALGVDFVKVHNGIPRDGYLAIAERVRELGWTFAGHVPRSITAAEASDQGQRSLEHLTGMPVDCTPAESTSVAPAGLISFLLGPCLPADLTSTYARLKANGTWITPTLSAFTSVLHQPTSPVDSMDKYRSASLRQLQQVVMRLPPMGPEAIAAARLLYGKRMAQVGALDRAGVAILAGSDSPTPGTFPGVSLHDELSLLVRGGLSAARALRAATWEPARYLAATDSMGTVAAGKVADLVLLNANPLSDITNTRAIDRVWLAGRMLNQTERQTLLARAAEAARPD